MMNISSINTNNADSPKTPGGISKSLLTPCRRVGLSRKWKKSGVSPFISPLSSASSNTEDKQEKSIRKRKTCNAEVEDGDNGDDSNGEIVSDTCNTPKIDIVRTPTRTLLPRKKSKTLLTAQKCQEEVENTPQSISELNKIILCDNDNLQYTNKKVIKPSILTTDDDKLQDTKVSKLTTAHKCQEDVENVPQSISELKNKIIISKSDNLTTDDDKVLDTKQVAKVSKLITAQHQVKVEKVSQCISELNNKNILNDEDNFQDTKQIIKVSKLSRKNSKCSNKIKNLKSPVINILEPSTSSSTNNCLESVKNEIQLKNGVKQKSPNNLTKECMDVIQKKIFKTDKNTTNFISTKNIQKSVPTKKSSQTLFDSDSDEVPLSDLHENVRLKKHNNVVKEKSQNKMEVNNAVEQNTQNQKDSNDATEKKSQNIVIDLTNIQLDSDFVEKKTINIKKIEKTTSITGLKKKAKEIPKTTKLLMKSVPEPWSQSSDSFNNDDDFDYKKSKTILLKRTYDKVTKPLKAKSTGSITQKDIDDIKARINSKKNLLLAKAMTNETKELRDLIKKWQHGCQTALIELLDLMKQKLPDQNMEHSQLLQMLKIPPDLVGYDSDSDCFNTPEDTAIILSAFKLN